MEKKSSGYQTGIASEHLVLSMLYRLGAKAYLTLGNEKSIDIRITKDDGSWISVDVKSVRKGNAIPVGNAVDKDNHYYVFVIYNNKFEGGNLAASKIRNLECPSYEICLIDYGCGKFNRKIHIMEQYP